MNQSCSTSKWLQQIKPQLLLAATQLQDSLWLHTAPHTVLWQKARGRCKQGAVGWAAPAGAELQHNFLRIRAAGPFNWPCHVALHDADVLTCMQAREMQRHRGGHDTTLSQKVCGNAVTQTQRVADALCSSRHTWEEAQAAVHLPD